MFWAFLGNLIKGVATGVGKTAVAIGKGAATGAKAIGFAGKELGKGMVGMTSKTSPLALGKTGSAAGAIAKAGQVANQIGKVIGVGTGISDITKGNLGPRAGIQSDSNNEDQNPMQQGGAPEIGGSTVAPTMGGGTPLAYASPQGQLELEMLRRRMYANS